MRNAGTVPIKNLEAWACVNGNDCAKVEQLVVQPDDPWVVLELPVPGSSLTPRQIDGGQEKLMLRMRWDGRWWRRPAEVAYNAEKVLV